jgi:hypothetical protein
MMVDIRVMSAASERETCLQVQLGVSAGCVLPGIAAVEHIVPVGRAVSVLVCARSSTR